CAPVLLRGVVRRQLEGLSPRQGSSLLAATVALATCALGSSLLFFLTTNFCTWFVTDWYSRSPSGLFSCYVQALPFLKYTVLGDLSFTAVLFGGYGLWVLTRQVVRSHSLELSAARGR
ncbi:MAG TPA: DUF6580 family putative transport protein, partial [Pirellulaceae bacterium]